MQDGKGAEILQEETSQFAIRETPFSLAAAQSAPTDSPLEAVDQDLRILLRTLAELRLAEQEQAQRYRTQTERLLLELLDLADAFERVFHNVQKKQDLVTPQMKKWLGNFRTLRRLLDNILGGQGVVRIENLDQGFDPHWHKICSTLTDPSQADGVIVEEVKRGYVWNGQLLRKAELIVVRNADEDE